MEKQFGSASLTGGFKNMIGGHIESISTTGDSILLVVRGKDSESHLTSTRELRSTNYELAVGDSIWWQGDLLFWTPANRSRHDIILHRMRRSSIDGKPIEITP